MINLKLRNSEKELIKTVCRNFATNICSALNKNSNKSRLISPVLFAIIFRIFKFKTRFKINEDVVCHQQWKVRWNKIWIIKQGFISVNSKKMGGAFGMEIITSN